MFQLSDQDRFRVNTPDWPECAENRLSNTAGVWEPLLSS